MLIGEIISVALGALRANKLRSMLTMLGSPPPDLAEHLLRQIGPSIALLVRDLVEQMGEHRIRLPLRLDDRRALRLLLAFSWHLLLCDR